MKKLTITITENDLVEILNEESYSIQQILHFSPDKLIEFVKERLAEQFIIDYGNSECDDIVGVFVADYLDEKGFITLPKE